MAGGGGGRGMEEHTLQIPAAVEPASRHTQQSATRSGPGEGRHAGHDCFLKKLQDEIAQRFVVAREICVHRLGFASINRICVHQLRIGTHEAVRAGASRDVTPPDEALECARLVTIRQAFPDLLWGLGFGFWGLGFGFWGLGFRV